MKLVDRLIQGVFPRFRPPAVDASPSVPAPPPDWHVIPGDIAAIRLDPEGGNACLAVLAVDAAGGVLVLVPSEDAPPIRPSAWTCLVADRRLTKRTPVDAAVDAALAWVFASPPDTKGHAQHPTASLAMSEMAYHSHRLAMWLSKAGALNVGETPSFPLWQDGSIPTLVALAWHKATRAQAGEVASGTAAAITRAADGVCGHDWKSWLPALVSLHRGDASGAADMLGRTDAYLLPEDVQNFAVWLAACCGSRKSMERFASMLGCEPELWGGHRKMLVWGWQALACLTDRDEGLPDLADIACYLPALEDWDWKSGLRIPAAVTAARPPPPERRDLRDHRDECIPSRRPATPRAPSEGFIPLDGVAGAEGDNLAAAYGTLLRPVRLVSAPSPDAVVATLTKEFPWMEDAIAALSDALELSAASSSKGFRLRPLIVYGHAGTGKSRLARRIAEVVGLPPTVLPCAGSSTAIELTGTAQGYSSRAPCLPLIAMHRHGVGNPAVVLDELDKAETDSRNGSLINAVLPFLEPETAQRHWDACMMGNANLSMVTWIITANSLDVFPWPLRSRCTILVAGRPRPEHFDAALVQIITDVAADYGIPRERMPNLPDTVIDTARRAFAGDGGLRGVRAVVEQGMARGLRLRRRHETEFVQSLGAEAEEAPPVRDNTRVVAFPGR